MYRLDKLVAKALDISRKQASKLVRSGKVLVDKQVEKSSNRTLSNRDSVEYDGQRLVFPTNSYILLNKPKGYICSTKDEDHPSALNLLNMPSTKGYHFAGRLDVDTTGLVLISNDGQWTHRITSPKNKKAKVYRVLLDSEITQEMVAKLEKGVLLRDSSKATAPSKVETIDLKAIKLSITEGRYHQVKRMLAAVGNRVIELHRESIGVIGIDDSVQLGEWRELDPSEIDSF